MHTRLLKELSYLRDRLATLNCAAYSEYLWGIFARRRGSLFSEDPDLARRRRQAASATPPNITETQRRKTPVAPPRVFGGHVEEPEDTRPIPDDFYSNLFSMYRKGILSERSAKMVEGRLAKLNFDPTLLEPSPPATPESMREVAQESCKGGALPKDELSKTEAKPFVLFKKAVPPKPKVCKEPQVRAVALAVVQPSHNKPPTPPGPPVALDALLTQLLVCKMFGAWKHLAAPRMMARFLAEQRREHDLEEIQRLENERLAEEQKQREVVELLQNGSRLPRGGMALNAGEGAFASTKGMEEGRKGKGKGKAKAKAKLEVESKEEPARKKKTPRGKNVNQEQAEKPRKSPRPKRKPELDPALTAEKPAKKSKEKTPRPDKKIHRLQLTLPPLRSNKRRAMVCPPLLVERPAPTPRTEAEPEPTMEPRVKPTVVPHELPKSNEQENPQEKSLKKSKKMKKGWSSMKVKIDQNEHLAWLKLLEDGSKKAPETTTAVSSEVQKPDPAAMLTLALSTPLPPTRGFDMLNISDIDTELPIWLVLKLACETPLPPSRGEVEEGEVDVAAPPEPAFVETVAPSLPTSYAATPEELKPPPPEELKPPPPEEAPVAPTEEVPPLPLELTLCPSPEEAKPPSGDLYQTLDPSETDTKPCEVENTEEMCAPFDIPAAPSAPTWLTADEGSAQATTSASVDTGLPIAGGLADAPMKAAPEKPLELPEGDGTTELGMVPRAADGVSGLPDVAEPRACSAVAQQGGVSVMQSDEQEDAVAEGALATVTGEAAIAEVRREEAPPPEEANIAADNDDNAGTATHAPTEAGHSSLQPGVLVEIGPSTGASIPSNPLSAAEEVPVRRSADADADADLGLSDGACHRAAAVPLSAMVPEPTRAPSPPAPANPTQSLLQHSPRAVSQASSRPAPPSLPSLGMVPMEGGSRSGQGYADQEVGAETECKRGMLVVPCTDTEDDKLRLAPIVPPSPTARAQPDFIPTGSSPTHLPHLVKPSHIRVPALSTASPKTQEYGHAVPSPPATTSPSTRSPRSLPQGGVGRISSPTPVPMPAPTAPVAPAFSLTLGSSVTHTPIPTLTKKPEPAYIPLLEPLMETPRVSRAPATIPPPASPPSPPANATHAQPPKPPREAPRKTELPPRTIPVSAIPPPIKSARFLALGLAAITGTSLQRRRPAPADAPCSPSDVLCAPQPPSDCSTAMIVRGSTLLATQSSAARAHWRAAVQRGLAGEPHTMDSGREATGAPWVVRGEHIRSNQEKTEAGTDELRQGRGNSPLPALLNFPEVPLAGFLTGLDLESETGLDLETGLISETTSPVVQMSGPCIQPPEAEQAKLRVDGQISPGPFTGEGVAPKGEAAGGAYVQPTAGNMAQHFSPRQLVNEQAKLRVDGQISPAPFSGEGVEPKDEAAGGAYVLPTAGNMAQYFSPRQLADVAPDMPLPWLYYRTSEELFASAGTQQNELTWIANDPQTSADTDVSTSASRFNMGCIEEAEGREDAEELQGQEDFWAAVQSALSDARAQDDALGMSMFCTVWNYAVQQLVGAASAAVAEHGQALAVEENILDTHDGYSTPQGRLLSPGSMEEPSPFTRVLNCVREGNLPPEALQPGTAETLLSESMQRSKLMRRQKRLMLPRILGGGVLPTKWRTRGVREQDIINRPLKRTEMSSGTWK
ncbi:hypothetical protein CYMTET_15227 [Cymbomonas tetramitiformis]|uniref:Uncharacterized protein n=1 Tax=Cymbomonas tetramitiformis TaxID=36881 RepID=A0AAE0L948_9CHLO|nr:hypothetical protein CYMTET_15227 [Cymbomonas tetramitiformis]